MALNIAVPLQSVGDLMDGFGLLSPISPLSVDCRAVVATGGAGSHAKKQLVSPVGSESSGVSSLDSDEIKKPSSPPSTPTEEVDQEPTAAPEALSPEATTAVSPPSSNRSSLSTSSSSSSDSGSGMTCADEPTTPRSSVDDECADTAVIPVPVTSPTKQQQQPQKPVQVVLGGRNVLDLYDNLTAPSHFRLQFAQLPENDNIHFFLDNRSQYHRLGANGHIQEYTMVKCKRCDFRYPVNGTSLTSSGPTTTMGQNCLASAFQPQQQHQQQQQIQLPQLSVPPPPAPQQQPPQAQFPWNGFTNNFNNSIANTRDKMSLNVAAANAFNKNFGSGNNNNNNGNMAAGLFGRDSNNRNGGGSFLNNNQKAYQQQQNFGGHFQQQQPNFSRNNNNGRHMRYNNNNQSNGSSNFNAVAAAAALINQQNLMQNFSGYNNGKNANNQNNNSNNMFAYYKNMM